MQISPQYNNNVDNTFLVKSPMFFYKNRTEKLKFQRNVFIIAVFDCISVAES